MEDFTYNPLLSITQEEMQNIRTFFGIDDDKKIEESLDAVKDWCKKQDHLAEAIPYLNRNLLERFLLLAKGSVEITKNKLDKMLTIRGMFPEIMLNKSYEEFETMFERVIAIPLKKLNPINQARCFVFQIQYDNLNENTILKMFRYIFTVGEFRTLYDYAVSDIYIMDLKYITLSVLTKINPILFKKAEIICTEAYGAKIKGIYLLNAPPFVDKFISVIKPFLKQKVASRLCVPSSYEDLHKEVSKEILPEDFGGTESSLAKLSEEWKDFLKTDEARKVIINSNKIKSDESKRSCYKFNEEYLGIPGSFRRMTVD